MEGTRWHNSRAGAGGPRSPLCSLLCTAHRSLLPVASDSPLQCPLGGGQEPGTQHSEACLTQTSPLLTLRRRAERTRPLSPADPTTLGVPDGSPAITHHLLLALRVLTAPTQAGEAVTPASAKALWPCFPVSRPQDGACALAGDVHHSGLPDQGTHPTPGQVDKRETLPPSRVGQRRAPRQREICTRGGLVSALPLVHCGTLGLSLHPCVPQFRHL